MTPKTMTLLALAAILAAVAGMSCAMPPDEAPAPDSRSLENEFGAYLLGDRPTALSDVARNEMPDGSDAPIRILMSDLQFRDDGTGGTEIVVPIVVHGGGTLAAWGFDLEFDPELVAFENCFATEGWPGCESVYLPYHWEIAGYNQIDANHVRIGGIFPFMDPPSADSLGLLAIVRFAVRDGATGEALFRFVNLNSDLESAVSNSGSITVGW